MKILSALILGYSLALCTVTSEAQISLSARDVEDLRHALNSKEQYPFSVRHEILKSAVFLLQKDGRELEAKQLLMSFILPIPYNREPDLPAIPPDLIKTAHAIDAGDYTEARNMLDAYIQSNPNPHASLSILAIKADHVPAAYYGLLADAKDQSFSAYSAYVIGILLMRSKDIETAARYFESVDDEFKNTPRLERWLLIDAAKFNQIIYGYEKAHDILDQLLEKNPQDVQALYWKARIFAEQSQNDRAKETLAQIIPLLYPDEFLVMETATLALRLDELERAASILADFETKLTPSKDYYSLFALIRELQNQPEAKRELEKKAQALPVPQEPVPSSWMQTTRLQGILKSIRDERREETRRMAEGNPLDKVFLFLLNEDTVEAKRTLQELIDQYPPFESAQFMLATIQRREGNIAESYGTLQALHNLSPDFRRYQVLSQLADFAVRLNDPANAGRYYDQIARDYPESYQAETAKRYQETGSQSDDRDTNAFSVSPLLTKYQTYSVPYVLRELLAQWGTQVTFPRIISQTRTSPRRGLKFHELVAFMLKGTQQRAIIPFSGSVEIAAKYLQQTIPVVFCKGGMFANQSLEVSGILTGYDTGRNVVYFESVMPNDPAVLTERELLEGICIAVYPAEQSIQTTDSMKESFAVGNEFIQLNAAALEMIQREAAKDSSPQEEYRFDPQKFRNRLSTLAKETGNGFAPLQIAALKYKVQQSPSQAKSYAKEIQPQCQDLAQFWSVKAGMAFQENQFGDALESIEQAISISPGNVWYKIGKVQALEKLNQNESAIALAEQLREEYPQNLNVSSQLLKLYEKTGNENKLKSEKSRLDLE